jgi:chromosome partitioning protein
MILTVGGEKGGPGKSTIATTLAAMRATAGRQVVLVNADAQPTAVRWSDARRTVDGVAQVTTVTLRGKQIHADISDLAKRYDDVVIDTGGHDSVELRAALVKSDRLLMPLRPSHFDVWTIEKMAEIVGQAQAINPDLAAMVVMNQVPAVSRDRLRSEMEAVMSEWPMFRLLDTVLIFRAAYGAAGGEGLTVQEIQPRDGKAAVEAAFLFKEVFAGA